jgi:hypothetical protein
MCESSDDAAGREVEGKLIDLAARGIDQEQAASLCSRLAAFAEDWQRPDMDAYDSL